ncbi:hypothetical protein FRB97_006531 [Tulasnella sp. 331]|nr:hypothetical protein FRB97_006531 [Tulasnella sp. 331]
MERAKLYVNLHKDHKVLRNPAYQSPSTPSRYMSLYTNSFTVADLKTAPNASSIQRSNTQRSLHGSQSHANFHFGGGESGYNNNNVNMNVSVGGSGTFNTYGMNDGGGASVGPGGGGGFGAGGGGGSGQQPQQYMPGYLLSASQGQPAPSQSHSFSLQPLETERTIKRSASAFGRGFGEDSLLTAARPSPKGRSPRAGATDDENAPPTISISESQYILSDSAAQRSMPRSTSGGFHPLSISRSTFTPSSSMSTTYESSTPVRLSNAMDEDPPSYHGYSITVFGFRPDQRQQAINAFITEQARVKEDEQESEEAKKARNWVEIEYVNQWEASSTVGERIPERHNRDFEPCTAAGDAGG